MANRHIVIVEQPSFLILLLRKIYRIIFFFFIAALVFGWFLWNNVGWIAGVGDHGMDARKAYVKEISRMPQDQRDAIAVDFRGGLASDVLVRIRTMEDDNEHGFGVPVETLNWNPDSAEVMPDVCHPSDMWTDTSLGSWSDRGDAWHNRKSARMFKDYRAGYLNIAALHYSLTYMKHDMLPNSLYSGKRNGHDLPSPRHTHGKAWMSYCNADVASLKSLPLEYMQSWYKASDSVRIKHAPIVRFQVTRRNTITQRTSIVGMCLIFNSRGQYRPCNLADGTSWHGIGDDLFYYVTRYDDIFAADPPLSPGQMDAERELLATGTDEFWLQAAHDNGIKDKDDEIRRLAALQRGYLAETNADHRIILRDGKLGIPYGVDGCTNGEGCK